MGYGAAVAEERRGRFIVLVGPDGAGKTEGARELIRRRSGRYFHFRPPLRTRSLLDSPPSDGGQRDVGSGPFPLGPVRLLRNVVLFWLGYLGSVTPTLRSGIDVIADRWAYGYLVQPTALKFSGPKWVARSLVSILPRPDLVINLTAAPETVKRRKPELSLIEIGRELDAWATLPLVQLVTVDAEPPVSVIVDQLTEELWR